jgi:hypothetical protein
MVAVSGGYFPKTLFDKTIAPRSYTSSARMKTEDRARDNVIAHLKLIKQFEAANNQSFKLKQKQDFFVPQHYEQSDHFLWMDWVSRLYTARDKHFKLLQPAKKKLGPLKRFITRETLQEAIIQGSEGSAVNKARFNEATQQQFERLDTARKSVMDLEHIATKHLKAIQAIDTTFQQLLAAFSDGAELLDKSIKFKNIQAHVNVPGSSVQANGTGKKRGKKIKLSNPDKSNWSVFDRKKLLMSLRPFTQTKPVTSG